MLPPMEKPGPRKAFRSDLKQGAPQHLHSRITVRTKMSIGTARFRPLMIQIGL